MAALLVSIALATEDPPEPAGGSAPSAEIVPPQIILTSQKVPAYPPAAKAGRFSASVMMEIEVATDGKIGEIKVTGCTQPKVGFEEAAVAAVKQWRFEPGRQDGEPVPYMLRFRLNFSPGGPGEEPQVSAGSFTTSTDDEPAMLEGETRSAARSGERSTRTPAPPRR